MAGLIDRLLRSARATKGNGDGNGAAKKPGAKKKAPAKKKAAGGLIEIALSKRNARPILRTLEDVGDQLNGRASMMESGAVDGSASEARELRAQAKQIDAMRFALAGAL